LISSLPQNLRSFIWHFLKEYKSVSVIFILLAAITGLWGPFNNILIKEIIDHLEHATPHVIAPVIIWIAVLFVLNFEIHNLCWRGMGYLNYKYQPVIKNKIITETYGYVIGASHQFFQDNLSGRISSQINSLAENIERIVHDISRHIVRGIVLLIVAFVTMYYVHKEFFYSLLVWSIIFGAISLQMSKRLVTLAEAHASTESVVSGNLVDGISNASTVRIFGRRNYEISFIERILLLTKQSFQAKDLFAFKLHLAQGISLSILLAFMLYFLIKLRVNNLVTIGDFALILGLSLEVGWMTWWTLEQVDELNKSIGKCKQSLANLFVPIGIKDKEDASILQVSKGQIKFDKVKFHYKGTDPLFQNKTVTIKAGQKVGLVGFSGSGKTTFVNLILRLFDVTDGKILIDNQDICEVTQDSLRSNIGMIPQEPSFSNNSAWLPSETIMPLLNTKMRSIYKIVDNL